MKQRNKHLLAAVSASVLLFNSGSDIFFSGIPVNNTVIAADAQIITDTLSGVLYRMSENVSEPNFGTIAGEWSVLCLARSGFYEQDNVYFEKYYQRIVDTVNETAASVNMNGALHKVKSTENSRLILALSSIGKYADSVGSCNLITPYNDFNWIKKQGLNGPVFALIALDTNNYQTADSTIRQQCIDFILSKELTDGGWALSGQTPDTDMTAMTLQALSRYKENADAAAAIERGINVLSDLQNEDGGYASWGTVNSESLAQVITACTELGIDPDTDGRFIKNGNSPVDAILKFYDSSSQMFCHTIGDGGNAMATDQCAYALISYQRFLNGENTLYNMTDSFQNKYISDTNIITAPADNSNAKTDEIPQTDEKKQSEAVTSCTADLISESSERKVTSTGKVKAVSVTTSQDQIFSYDINNDGVVNAQDVLDAADSVQADEIAYYFLHGKVGTLK